MTCCAAFPTTIGSCAIAWRKTAVTGVALPGRSARETIRAASGRCDDVAPADPPAWVVDVIARIARLLDGDPVDLSDISLALDDLAPFETQVYRATLAIRHGETRTYGELARAIGQPGAARAVGRALGRNPIPIIIPCHRVLAADGRSGGFSAPGGVSTKLRLLAIERALSGTQPGLFDDPVWAAAPVRP